MNRLAGTFALISLVASSVVAAQTSPGDPPTSTQGMPMTQDQSATAPAPSTSTSQPAQNADTSSASSSKADKKAAINDCIAQQRANNPQMSKHDAKKTCKDQVNSSSQGH
jgi:hypothetical protein